MKESIYTIPIQEAFEEAAGGGCPLCLLRRKLENESLDYILGGAMMEPDIRIKTNARGFCRTHYEGMSALRRALSMALVMQTHLQELVEKPELKLNEPESCFLCERVTGYMEKYCENILYLWDSEPEFQAKFQSTPVICMTHAAALWKRTPKVLSKKRSAAFQKELEARTVRALKALEEDVSLFCKSFDHRYAGMELGDAKTGVERSLRFLTAEESL